jgi:hypothetical protein
MNPIIYSCYAHYFFKIETACHFERSEKSAEFRFLAALEMTVAMPISGEALCVTSVSKIKPSRSSRPARF